VPSIAPTPIRPQHRAPLHLPDNDLSFTGNFLNMLFKMTELKYSRNPVLERALDVLFILHADTSRTAARRRCERSGARTWTRIRRSPARRPRSTGRCTAAPNEAVLRMLNEIRIGRQRAGVHQAGQVGEAKTG
jgi:citrate synthase